MKTGDIIGLVAKGRQHITDEDFVLLARMACRAVELQEVLTEVYEHHGPGARGGGVDKEPAKEYAKLTPKEIDDTWDFDNRHLMHKVAKALV